MTNFALSKCLPYSCQQLFELVADVKSYPEFVPGIIATTVVGATSEGFQSEVTFGNAFFHEHYTCTVHLQPFKRIDTQAIKGPFSNLESYWLFHPVKDGQHTDLYFHVNFSFKNKLLQKIASPVFDKLTQTMIQAFESRARLIYGNQR